MYGIAMCMSMGILDASVKRFCGIKFGLWLRMHMHLAEPLGTRASRPLKLLSLLRLRCWLASFLDN